MILTWPEAFAKMDEMTWRPVPARLSVISMSWIASISPAGFTSSEAMPSSAPSWSTSMNW